MNSMDLWMAVLTHPSALRELGSDRPAKLPIETQPHTA
jgi:hypothetical protein